MNKLNDIDENLNQKDHVDILERSRQTLENIMTVVSRRLSLGQMLETSTNDVTITVKKDVLEGIFQSRSKPGASFIDFGHELQQRYSAAWDCSDDSLLTCSGVIILIQHYEGTMEHLMLGDNIIQSADMLDVYLANPKTGEILDVTNLTVPVTITFPLFSGPPLNSEVYCYYWDNDHNAWSRSGVHSLVNESRATVKCNTTHLTQFTVLSVAQEMMSSYYPNI
uniref:Uncharacterized protein LOC102809551 n=1 Tax=Saccoglossus kowalevskii TaxID=10224 RepID=A0ABM0MUG5_SACKO